MTVLLIKKKDRLEGACRGSSVRSAAKKGSRETSPLFKVSLLSTAVLLGTNPW